MHARFRSRQPVSELGPSEFIKSHKIGRPQAAKQAMHTGACCISQSGIFREEQVGKIVNPGDCT